MATRFIGLKEFRANMAKIAAAAIKKNERIILVRKNVPIFELRPLSKKERTVESLAEKLKKSEADYKAGRWHTLEEVEKRLGIK